MLLTILQNLASFILIISFIVFVHEFGHFYVARICGVKVEVFSIGFGKEIFGFFDKKGTRWKFCLIPMGGYVKMFGDKSAASNADFDKIENFSETQKKQSFIFKNVYQRIAIVAAGPISNFLLAIAIFSILFFANGSNKALPIVDKIIENSAAEKSGLKNGDKILAINDKKIIVFSDMQEIVARSAEKQLNFKVLRNEKIINVKIIPQFRERKNIFGETNKIGMIGVSTEQIEHFEYNLWQSFYEANKEVVRISGAIFSAIYELITGERDLKELGGPIKIAKYSGKTASLGLTVMLWFMALISLNLGVMNLLPLPVLDGGHLLFYFYEAIFNKPLSPKIQEMAFRFGFVIVLSLMFFTTYNDLSQILN